MWTFETARARGEQVMAIANECGVPALTIHMSVFDEPSGWSVFVTSSGKRIWEAVPSVVHYSEVFPWPEMFGPLGPGAEALASKPEAE